MSPLNALTIDVEDYYHVTAFEKDIERSSWGEFPSRVEQNTRNILRLLEQHDTRATFFVLGWVAERFPQLVRDIAAAGHEIGSHSYWHRLVYRLTPAEFREDLCHSRDVLEGVLGRPVRAFRAASFSITKRSWWALEILAEEGFKVDSSVFPIHHDRYGVPDARPDFHTVETPSGEIWEFPPSVLRVGLMNLPVSGGGYFRLYPYALTRRCLRRINRVARRPFVFYIHPWETDADQPRLGLGSRTSRLRHYVNLKSTQAKLGALLGEFRFGRLCDVVDAG